MALLAGCGGRQHVETPAPTQPLPTAGLAAQQVSVLPLTLLAAEDSLNWQARSEEHTSELQSRPHLVCRLLLEKKKSEEERSYNTQSRHNIYLCNTASERGL